MLEGIWTSNHWIVKMNIKKEQVYLVSTKSDINQPIHVWHKCLGHISKDRILELVHHELVTGISISKDKSNAPCGTCIQGKMTATKTVAKEDLCAQGPCLIIHVDLEFMGVKSFSGTEISIKFICKYSNYVWAYAIKTKDGKMILELWTYLVELILTQFSIHIKALHTDNGTEFVNNTMNAFNLSWGIEHHRIVPYRHKMNGHAERL